MNAPGARALIPDFMVHVKKVFDLPIYDNIPMFRLSALRLLSTIICLEENWKNASGEAKYLDNARNFLANIMSSLTTALSTTT